MKTKYKPGEMYEGWECTIAVIERVLSPHVYRVSVSGNGKILYTRNYAQSEMDRFVIQKIEV